MSNSVICNGCGNESETTEKQRDTLIFTVFGQAFIEKCEYCTDTTEE